MYYNKTTESDNSEYDSQEKLKNDEYGEDFNLNVDMSKIKSEQRKDEFLANIINYLENDVLPQSQKDARRLLLEAPDYIVVNEILYHARNSKSARNKKMAGYQFVVPKSMIDSVLKMSHDAPLGGHNGIQNTLDRIKENFYFPRMGKIVTDYVRSCHQCQTRKVTNLKTQAKMVAYKTPNEPFQVWQIDLFGPVKASVNGNQFIFTAVDMFSKFLYVRPLRNKDMITVSNAIFQLVAQFGVCESIISDQGTEFIGKCTQEVCRLLGIHQDFIPSFAHHCLGLCERTHRTLSERITPYMQDHGWEFILPAVVFSINSSVSPSTKYSPFEILYGKRPSFPLSVQQTSDIKNLPKDMQSYMNENCQRLTIIRNAVKANSTVSKQKMEETMNAKIHELELSIGDYVYLEAEVTGQGRKFQNTYNGPYTVTGIPSPHLISLRDPEGKRKFKRPVHVNRLKLAHVRAPDPHPYFHHNSDISPSGVTSEESSEEKLSENTVSEVIDDDQQHLTAAVDTDNGKPLRRTSRQVRKPVRYRDSEFINPSAIDSSDSIDSNNKPPLKIKRILAKRKVGSAFKYLVQKIGEPAENAEWLTCSQLPPKAQQLLVARPPPLIE